VTLGSLHNPPPTGVMDQTRIRKTFISRNLLFERCPHVAQEGLGRVDRLVTLGSPHNPPPPGVVDQTRGILSHVASTCPANFHEQARSYSS